jgi:hypothetical protein
MADIRLFQLKSDSARELQISMRELFHNLRSIPEGSVGYLSPEPKDGLVTGMGCRSHT